MLKFRICGGIEERKDKSGLRKKKNRVCAALPFFVLVGRTLVFGPPPGVSDSLFPFELAPKVNNGDCT